MEKSTELREVKRSIKEEIPHRIIWFVVSVAVIALLALIPVIGWILALVMVFAVFTKIFGFRESFLVGNCPTCTKLLPVPDTDVFACPVCNSVIAVGEDSLTIVKTD
ncbi:hypothetical protein [Pseudomonas sp. COW5]|uniref:hypothetical protein n=1 Tax=Pseudomonas sp. COW5 TaxID=2981253 RepID=UPI002245AB44|nr:hypothetical protein [Pseudomonas sp. COW5]MCX2542063.1 hypothetical protein [Pseudomonas sp. COW5]